jgi:hypothetical protein
MSDAIGVAADDDNNDVGDNCTSNDDHNDGNAIMARTNFCPAHTRTDGGETQLKLID